MSPKFSLPTLTLSDTAKRLVPLIFAVLFGLVAMLLARHLITEQRRALQRERERLMANYQEPIPVVVAASDLERDVTLDATKVKIAQVPKNFVQPYAVSRPEEVIGLVTVAQMAEGEQILLNKLRRPEEAPVGSTLSSVTPSGKRAVTITVDAITGVGGFVRPGDNVDIMWTINVKEGQPLTLTMFQGVPVLAVGTVMVGQTTQPAAEASPNVTLALMPQEISILLLARQQGQIQLALRPRQESGQVAVSPVDINILMQKVLGIPQNIPPQQQAENQPPKHEVEVFKGLQRDVVVLRNGE